MGSHTLRQLTHLEKASDHHCLDNSGTVAETTLGGSLPAALASVTAESSAVLSDHCCLVPL